MREEVRYRKMFDKEKKDDDNILQLFSNILLVLFKINLNSSIDV